MRFFFCQKKDYGLVDNEDDVTEGGTLSRGEKLFHKPKESRWNKSVAIGLLVLGNIIVTTLLNLMVIAARTQKKGQGLEIFEELHCGNSVEEAKALGCTFDQLTLLWLPQGCARTGNQEFLQFSESSPINETWGYWVDKEATTPILDVSLQVNDDGFWTTQREHTSHCAFQFLRLIDAARGDGIFDYKTWSEEHGYHCANVLLNRAMMAPGIDEDMQWARVKFGTCSRRGFLKIEAGN